MIWNMNDMFYKLRMIMNIFQHLCGCVCVPEVGTGMYWVVLGRTVNFGTVSTEVLCSKL